MKTTELQRQFYDLLMESQYWSPGQMQQHQRGQIEQLLRHARANVPFFEHRLDPVFTAGDDVDWDRWSSIPIMRRGDLIEHKEALRARVLPPGHGPVGIVHSSGSTGHPVETAVTRLGKLSSDATAWRAGQWQGYDYSQPMLLRNGHDTDIVPPTPRQAGTWGPPWDASAGGPGYLVPRWWPGEAILDAIADLEITYLGIGGTKSAYLLAQTAERLGVAPQLARILVNGEEVSADDRAICRRVFGAEIVDLYSSKEAGHIAHPCPSGSGYHVNSERIFVELLDDDDRPVPVGQTGRIVVTSFYNTAQPLIRYDHGDLATWGPPCRCGRHLPLLASLDGRTGTMFRHPDGRGRARGMPMDYLEILGASMWQLAQIGPVDYEIRYVPVSAGRVGDEKAVAAAFRQHIFEDANVSFKRLEAIPLTASGKYMEYVNEFSARQGL